MTLFLLALACTTPAPQGSKLLEAGEEGADVDGDGWTAAEGDCDDASAEVNPTAVELCDGRDQDCDGEVDEGVRQTYYPDADQDGYGDPSAGVDACERPAATVQIATDCDDANGAAFPGATESCDGVDNNCDGAADEGLVQTWWIDQDADGFGDPSQPQEACTQPARTTDNAEDCDDTRPEMNPLEEEVCDELDNNCDGSVDEGVTTTFYADLDGDGFGNGSIPQDACVRPTGYAALPTDCLDADPLVFPGAPEVCNVLDDDCDGDVDEGAAAAPTWYTDADADGHGAPGSGVAACEAPAGTVALSDDCDDTRASAYAGATEVCDGVDNDCDGTSDESDAVDAGAWYLDGDGDGWGVGFPRASCSALPGTASRDGDCDDAFVSRYPGASETCNDADDDCDGGIDEDLPTSAWYRDADSDGFGSAASGSSVDCAAPSGYVSSSTDCDDTRSGVSPAATETCNGLDDDCDGGIDEDLATSTWYRDADGDGFGATGVSAASCSAPSGYVATAGDCNDGSGSVSPGAPERCNGVDDNCDGRIDEGVIGSSAACPATDCAQILSYNPSASSGTYVLTRGSYVCDMSTDGGGWTRVRASHAVYGTTWDGTAANGEGFTWDEVWFGYAGGSTYGHCAFPGDIASCNSNGFRFGSEDWGLPARWGSSTFGLPLTSYESATRYLSGANWVVARGTSTDTIQLAHLEGVSGCTLGDNAGVAYIDIWLRR